MKYAELKLIANAAELGFNVDETKPLFEIFEKAFDFVLEYARDNDYEGFEKVEGEFGNHYSHLYAMSKDGTEYECDGEIWFKGVKAGDEVGNFFDKDGKMVFVTCKECDADEGAV